MGYMGTTLDPYSQVLIDFAPSAPGPFLDVGAAYGVASLAALRSGCRVMANDLDERHLKILWEKTPKSLRDHLQLVPGSFPDQLKIKPHSLGAVLVSRLFHFFDGPTIMKAVGLIFNWLAPRGKVAVVADTIYLRPYFKFLPIYQERYKAQDPWPGVFEDGQKYNKKRAKFLPKLFHCLDPEVLNRVFTRAGFQIEKVEVFPRLDYFPDTRLDGRENVGVLARKP